MIDPFAQKLKMLGFALPIGHIPSSEDLVAKFERRFDLDLPSDFRDFLVLHGGMRGRAECSMLEPTPFGDLACIDGFYGFNADEIGDTTELIDGAPEIIALGMEPLGRMFWLFCSEPFRGSVFIRDHYRRSTWSDEDFFKWPDLAPEIRHYLKLRRSGELPKKLAGFDDVYLVARSFTEFIERLQPRE